LIERANCLMFSPSIKMSPSYAKSDLPAGCVRILLYRMLIKSKEGACSYTTEVLLQ